MQNDYLAGWFSNVDLPGEVVPPLRFTPLAPGCAAVLDNVRYAGGVCAAPPNQIAAETAKASE
jgi:hypothetical protein